MPDAILVVKNLLKTYQSSGFFSLLRPSQPVLPAVDGVNLSLFQGENLGLIGESGSGKTTLGRCIVKLETIEGGTIHLFGSDITQLGERKFRPFRQKIQMIFQDLDAALNPAVNIKNTLEEIIIRHTGLRNSALNKRLHALLTDVNLAANVLYKYPNELSGGQKRRIAIAAVLAIEPQIIIADEPTTGLDSYTQTLVLQLMTKIQKQRGLSLLFISHDLPLVQQYCHRIAVLYLGNIVEIGHTQQIISQQTHPYTRLLWNAHKNQQLATIAKPGTQSIQSGLYDYERPQTGCRFAPRCERYEEMGKPNICTAADTRPELTCIAEGHQVACHFPISYPQSNKFRIKSTIKRESANPMRNAG